MFACLLLVYLSLSLCPWSDLWNNGRIYRAGQSSKYQMPVSLLQSANSIMHELPLGQGNGLGPCRDLGSQPDRETVYSEIRLGAIHGQGGWSPVRDGIGWMMNGEELPL